MGPDFIYAQPVKLFFGEGKFAKLPEILQELGVRRCVIACGKHFAPTAQAMQAADDRIVAVFGAVEQNPQLSGVKETARLAREAGADAVLGVGGGSALDTAKFAAAIALGDGEAEDYYYARKPFPAERLTIIAVPTTAGTGSEVTQVSVVSNGTEKKTINNPVFMPKAAVVDPVLSSTVPPRTTMNTGLDAMAHALEGYWSRNHQPISDLMAIESVRLVLENLEKAYHDGTNMEARANMAFASLLGGLSFALPKTAGSHACSYPLSEDYHLPHGEAVAFTLDSFVRINADERLELLCRRVGLSGTEELAERIAALKELGGLRRRLSDLGDVDLDKLAHDCAVHGLMQNNPIPMDEEKLRAMFEKLA
ncbi:MAG: iron-containing alcohol dehydrogenase [Oscillospiraceae bacterium]|nr:iron-containing alcohol dehydrogenase [Oscillospiraceae bacterium]